MTAVPFDTLKFASKLESGGFTPEQAKAATEAFFEARSEQLAMKTDIAPLTKNEDRLTRIKAKIDLLEWMLGFVLAGILALVIKAYFPN
jgi:hypothetical protein